MWSVKDNGIWDISITDENGGTICHVNNKGDWFPNGKGDVSGRSHNEMISDAKLIAAAPYLYAALEMLVRALDNDQYVHQFSDLAKVALMKARGEPC